MEIGQVRRPITGALQGGVISSLLSGEVNRFLPICRSSPPHQFPTLHRFLSEMFFPMGTDADGETSPDDSPLMYAVLVLLRKPQSVAARSVDWRMCLSSIRSWLRNPFTESIV